MAGPALVDTQIDDGERIIKQLDEDGFDVDSAFWIFNPDKEKWVFVIATSLVAQIGPKKSYDRLRSSLDKLPESIKSQMLEMSLVKREDFSNIGKSPGGQARWAFWWTSSGNGVMAGASATCKRLPR